MPASATVTEEQSARVAALRLPIAEIARQADLHPGTLTAWLNGNNPNMSVGRISRLERALDRLEREPPSANPFLDLIERAQRMGATVTVSFPPQRPR